MIRLALACWAVALLPSGEASAQPPAPQLTVRVAAAADLKFALDELIARFATRHPSINVLPVYGSSGSMHSQLRQRAPFDVYLSADLAYPQDLVARGVGANRDVFAYAVGRLVLWVPLNSPLDIEREALQTLAKAGRIAIANPRHAPYGKAAESALRRAGLWDHLQGVLVLGENVAQAAQFVESGAADAGIIAKSLALTPAMQRRGRFWEVPQEMYPTLVQGGLILPWARSRDAAVRFRDFLLSGEGQGVLAAHGFDAPAAQPPSP
jgi:molybdate transport system substrate-binding protein